MQMLLPIFPHDIKLITETVGVFTRDGIVNYCHCGVPIFSHTTEDLKSFRYITSKLIIQGICRKIEISRCFGVSYDSVNRHVKKLREQGDTGFFANDNRRGHCYKLLPEVVDRMQGYLEDGKNNSEIARVEGVSEGAVRYAIKKGILKKNELNS
jgi:DNA-binding CsgD family transcriptional regulator